MANPNVIETSSTLLTSGGGSLGTSAGNLIVNGAASNNVIRVSSLYVSVVDMAASPWVTIQVVKAGGSTIRLAHQIEALAGSTVIVIASDAPVYLLEGDSLQGLAEADSDAEWFANWEILS